MKEGASVFALLAVCASACGSDPPAATTPTNATAAATTPPPEATAQQASVDPPAPTVAATTPPPAATTTPPAATDPAPASGDFASCMNKSTKGSGKPPNEACRSCISTSCSAQIHSIASACPDLVKCVCSDRSLLDCAMTYNTPACTQAGQAIGACQRQSCSAQCTPPPSAGGTATPPPS